MKRSRIAAALLIALTLGCSGKDSEPKADARYLTVFVAKDGEMEVGGREASLLDLENALKAAAPGTLVLFAREPSERDRAAHGMLVLQTIRAQQLPIRFCRNRDFSDAIAPDGKLRPE